MKKESILGVVVALIVGLLGGYLIFSVSAKKETVPASGSLPQGTGSPTDYQQRIAEEEKILAGDRLSRHIGGQRVAPAFEQPLDSPRRCL